MKIRSISGIPRITHINTFVTDCTGFIVLILAKEMARPRGIAKISVKINKANVKPKPERSSSVISQKLIFSPFFINRKTTRRVYIVPCIVFR